MKQDSTKPSVSSWLTTTPSSAPVFAMSLSKFPAWKWSARPTTAARPWSWSNPLPGRGLHGYFHARSQWLEATERIVKAFPEVRVIILSRHENEEYYWRALESGRLRLPAQEGCDRGIESGPATRRRRGNLSKPGNLHPPAQAASLAANRPSRNPVEQLTERQREILQLIAEGQTTKAIALILRSAPRQWNTIA